MKRRILSLMLALAMLISLLPAVSFAGAEAEEQEFTITTAGETENCGWEVVSSSGYNATPSLQADGYKVKFRQAWFNAPREDRSYHAMFRINVKAAGTYTLQAKGAPESVGNEISKMGVFWLKDEKSEESTFELVGGSDRSNSAALVGSPDIRTLRQ